MNENSRKYEFVSETFKLQWNYVRDRICHSLRSEMREFIRYRRQVLFDIAAKPIDVDSNILSYPAALFLFQHCAKYNLICSW